MDILGKGSLLKAGDKVERLLDDVAFDAVVVSVNEDETLCLRFDDGWVEDDVPQIEVKLRGSSKTRRHGLGNNGTLRGAEALIVPLAVVSTTEKKIVSRPLTAVASLKREHLRLQHNDDKRHIHVATLRGSSKMIVDNDADLQLCKIFGREVMAKMEATSWKVRLDAVEAASRKLNQWDKTQYDSNISEIEFFCACCRFIVVAITDRVPQLFYAIAPQIEKIISGASKTILQSKEAHAKMDKIISSLVNRCSEAHTRTSTIANEIAQSIIKNQNVESMIGARLICRHVFRGAFNRASKKHEISKGWRSTLVHIKLLKTVLEIHGNRALTSMHASTSKLCLTHIVHPRLLVRESAEDVLSLVTVVHALDRARMVSSNESETVISNVLEDAFNTTFSNLKFLIQERLRLKCSKKLDEMLQKSANERRAKEESSFSQFSVSNSMHKNNQSNDIDNSVTSKTYKYSNSKVKKYTKQIKNKKHRKIRKSMTTIDKVSYASPLDSNTKKIAKGITFAFGENVARALWSSNGIQRRNAIRNIMSTYSTLKFVDPETGKAVLLALQVGLLDNVVIAYIESLYLLRLVTGGSPLKSTGEIPGLASPEIILHHDDITETLHTCNNIKHHNNSILEKKIRNKIPRIKLSRVIKILQNPITSVRSHTNSPLSANSSYLVHMIHRFSDGKSRVREATLSALLALAQTGSIALKAVAVACYQSAGIERCNVAEEHTQSNNRDESSKELQNIDEKQKINIPKESFRLIQYRLRLLKLLAEGVRGKTPWPNITNVIKKSSDKNISTDNKTDAKIVCTHLSVPHILAVADLGLNVAHRKIRRLADELFETIIRFFPKQCKDMFIEYIHNTKISDSLTSRKNSPTGNASSIATHLSAIGQERLSEIIAQVEGETAALESMRQMQENAVHIREAMSAKDISRVDKVDKNKNTEDKHSESKYGRIAPRRPRTSCRPRTAMRTATSSGRTSHFVLPYAPPLDHTDNSSPELSGDIVSLLGEDTVRCIFAKGWEPRHAVMQLLNARIRRMAAEMDAKSEGTDCPGLADIDVFSDLCGVKPLPPGNLALASQLLIFAQRAIEDNIKMVYNGGLALLSAIMELYIPTLNVTHVTDEENILTVRIPLLLQAILSRSCSSNIRVASTAETALMMLCSDSYVGPAQVMKAIYHRLIQLEKKIGIKPRIDDEKNNERMVSNISISKGRVYDILSILRLFVKIITRYGKSEYVLGISLNTLNNFAVAAKCHREKKVRIEAMNLLNILHSGSNSDKKKIQQKNIFASNNIGTNNLYSTVQSDISNFVPIDDVWTGKECSASAGISNVWRADDEAQYDDISSHVDRTSEKRDSVGHTKLLPDSNDSSMQTNNRSKCSITILPYSKPLRPEFDIIAKPFISMFGVSFACCLYSSEWRSRVAAMIVCIQRIVATIRSCEAGSLMKVNTKSRTGSTMSNHTAEFQRRQPTPSEISATSPITFTDRKDLSIILDRIIDLVVHSLNDPIIQVWSKGLDLAQILILDWIPKVMHKDRRSYAKVCPIIDIMVLKLTASSVKLHSVSKMNIIMHQLLHYAEKSSQCRGLISNAIQFRADDISTHSNTSEDALVAIITTMTHLLCTYGFGQIPVGSGLIMNSVMVFNVKVLKNKWKGVRESAKKLYATAYFVVGKNNSKQIHDYVKHLRTSLLNDLDLLAQKRIAQSLENPNSNVVFHDDDSSSGTPINELFDTSNVENSSNTHKIILGPKDITLFGKCYGTDEHRLLCLCDETSTPDVHSRTIYYVIDIIKQFKDAHSSIQPLKDIDISQFDNIYDITVKEVWRMNCKIMRKQLQMSSSRVLVATLKLLRLFGIRSDNVLQKNADQNSNNEGSPFESKTQNYKKDSKDISPCEYFTIPWNSWGERLAISSLIKSLLDIICDSRASVRALVHSTICELAKSHTSALDIITRNLFANLKSSMKNDQTQKLSSDIKHQATIFHTHDNIHKLRVLRSLILAHGLNATSVMTLDSVIDVVLDEVSSENTLRKITAQSIIKTAFTKVDSSVIQAHFVKLPGHIQGIIFPLLPPQRSPDYIEKRMTKQFCERVQYKDEDGNLCSLASRRREGSVDRLRKSLGHANRLSQSFNGDQVSSDIKMSNTFGSSSDLTSPEIISVGAASDDSDSLYDFEM